MLGYDALLGTLSTVDARYAVMSSHDPSSSPDSTLPAADSTPPTRRIKIGSQRDPVRPPEQAPADAPDAADEAASNVAPPAETPAVEAPAAETPPEPAAAPPEPVGPPPTAPRKFPPPNLREKLPADLEAELEAALGDDSIDDLLGSAASSSPSAELEPDTRVTGRVVSSHQENVFLDLGGRNQGIVPLKQFEEPPELGSQVEVVVHRFDPEEGLYELTRPGAAVDVGDWSQVTEGMVVEAVVTGHNKGGLECEVNSLRGFIPASQISIYRVDNLEECVGQRYTCLVTECNPERRNLVLSHRAMLEREAAAAKEKLMAELAPGQIREGTVRNIRDFGAFVDLGGVDGLLHVSQLSWARVRHPGELLEVGQAVKVKILKIDPDTGKIGLGMRDLFENPWNQAARKYPVRSTVQGRVSKIMEFGAFVELEPGIEGLVHISELSHRRVWRATDVVQEGAEIEAQVLSVDVENQRISLSMKALEARSAPAKAEEPEDDEPVVESPAPKKRTEPLRGGREASRGGERFGLKW